jgi:hypothetical protein
MFQADISSGFYPFKNGNTLLYRILNVLTHSFKPTYDGWANDPDSGAVFALTP